MEYLKYDEFEDMGGTISEEAFPRFELRARRLIDRMTHYRIAGESKTRECVKNCMYELVSAMAADETAAGAAGKTISSMSNDGVSVTFSAEHASTQYACIVRDWLTGERAESGVQLLYAGVDA